MHCMRAWLTWSMHEITITTKIRPTVASTLSLERIMSITWEVSFEDVETALNELGLDSSVASVDSALKSLDDRAIEREVLRSDDFDEQYQLALDEIKRQLAPKSSELLVGQSLPG